MKKIGIAIADGDSFYLKQLTNYLVKAEQSFEVYAFSRQDSLTDFLTSSERKPDILLISENMRCEASDLCRIEAKILLSEGVQEETTGYDSILKYQKTAALVGQIMLIYGKRSGKGDKLVSGNRETKFIGLYSPVGGSGKTTLSLLLANRLGVRKKKVFYMNMERVDSTRGFLPAQAQIGVSDLLVAVHAKEKTTGLSLLSKMCQSQQFGFSYVNPPESSLEYNEVSIEEHLELLREIESLGQFDMVILDFDSELNQEKLQMLDFCDKLVVPFLPDAMSLNKFMQFFREMELREELSGLEKRMIFVGNRIGQGVEDYMRRCGVYQKCAPVVLLPVSGQLANPMDALVNSNAQTGLEVIAEQLCQ